MIVSVSGLETLSQAVRLAEGTLELGITKGNIETPAVPITPAIASDEVTKAQPVRPAKPRARVSMPAMNTVEGTSHSSGQRA